MRMCFKHKREYVMSALIPRSVQVNRICGSDCKFAVMKDQLISTYICTYWRLCFPLKYFCTLK